MTMIGVWEIQIFIENPIDSGLAMNLFSIKLTDFKNVKDSLCCNNKILKFQWLITTKALFLLIAHVSPAHQGVLPTTVIQTFMSEPPV